MTVRRERKAGDVGRIAARAWKRSGWRSCAGSRRWGSTPGASGSTATRRSPRSARSPLPEASRAETAAGPTVRVAGRIMLRRGQGKVNFLQLRDWTGAIQIFVGKNQVGEAGWACAELLDLGDLIGVDGTLGLHQDRRADRLRRRR